MIKFFKQIKEMAKFYESGFWGTLSTWLFNPKVYRDLYMEMVISPIPRANGRIPMPRKNKKWKKGWKVIRTEINVSAGQGIHKKRRSVAGEAKTVYYAKDQVTERPHDCGPLAVFKKEAQAKNFVKNSWPSHTNILIVKCEYLLSDDIGLWKLWRNGYRQICLLDDLPKGTVLADKVKCLE